MKSSCHIVDNVATAFFTYSAERHYPYGTVFSQGCLICVDGRCVPYDLCILCRYIHQGVVQNGIADIDLVAGKKEILHIDSTNTASEGEQGTAVEILAGTVNIESAVNERCAFRVPVISNAIPDKEYTVVEHCFQKSVQTKDINVTFPGVVTAWVHTPW